ncbi:hypothetical protein Bpfe_023952, partial [Biomphalaria pfeifferi]
DDKYCPDKQVIDCNLQRCYFRLIVRRGRLPLAMVFTRQSVADPVSLKDVVPVDAVK